MLIITRQRGTTFQIGEGADAVIVHLVDIRGDKIRVGIDAPRAVPVFRGEMSHAERDEVSQAAAQRTG